MPRHLRRPTGRRTLAAMIGVDLALAALCAWGLSQPPTGPDTSGCALVAGTTLYCR